eukprot:jgi/Chlat1/7973/Chrsp69S07406
MTVAEDGGAAAEEAQALVKKLGLDARTAQNALANAKVKQAIYQVIEEAGSDSDYPKSTGNLLYSVATKFPPNALPHRPTLCRYIATERVKSVPQLDAALAFLAALGAEALDEKVFEQAAGVGVVVSREDIAAAVTNVLDKHKARVLEERYRTNVGLLLAEVRSALPWADGKVAKEEFDAQLKALLGERTAADDEKPNKKKKEKKPKEDEPTAKEAGVVESKSNEATAPPEEEAGSPFDIFPRPEDNNIVHTEIRFSDGNVWRPANTREELQRHLAITGGKVRTRFPPEPNGYLHIGHAKAMNIDFGLAKEREGGCFLRRVISTCGLVEKWACFDVVFDDTNPEAEKQEYIDHIQEIVAWLGWTPMQVTYSSDYFQQLYELAVELIKRGYAYVCHQTGDEIKAYREQHKDSPWRDRPIAESLKLFEDMRRGLMAEGSATLRMKQDMKNDNFNMYDLIAYRIKYTPHPHAGDKWCIYPSYDYTHCLVDSLEHVTHSLCTLEFETRRASYYWLLQALDLYKPHVWEFARLNVTNNVVSKRKLNKLVTEGHVRGWDDPRLLTLAGLRRRGASPDAINAFCRGLGITRSDNTIRMVLLEHYIRDDMNRKCPRTMAVLRPLKVVITNLAENHLEHVDALERPDQPETSATYKIPFSRVVYIEQSDFRMQDSKDYYGLAPGKTAMLRYAYPIRITQVITEGGDSSTIKELRAEYDSKKSTKPKGVLHWVAQPAPGIEPAKAEIRLYDLLFKSDDPNSIGDDWLMDVNPNSLEVVTGALLTSALAKAHVGDKFQFERLGYFCVDPDSTKEQLVFNRTVTLRESKFVKALH